MTAPQHPTTKAASHAAAALLTLLAAPAITNAQSFGVVGSTSPIQERVAGSIVLAEGTPATEPGDEIGAFFNDQLVGAQTISAQAPLSFSFIINGDDPSTTDVIEGPALGQTVEFRYFDASRNAVVADVQPLNSLGEELNYTFAGQEVPDLPPGGFPIDLVPTASIDLRLGTATTAPGNGNTGNGDGNNGAAQPAGLDLNGDGRVTIKDAAVVLRIVAGSTLAGVTPAQADVNNDNTVSIADAILILRNRDD